MLKVPMRNVSCEVEVIRPPAIEPKTQILYSNPNPKSGFTLFSHIYNEEFLLPFWIKHHKPMFDHAVIVDYGSTDRSIEIIREMAPDWEILKTRNEFFEEPHIGAEMMAIEDGYRGWKMILNTTEFLFHPNPKDYISKLPNRKKGIRTSGIIMVDTPASRSSIDPNIPLVLQKTHGYFENDVIQMISTTGVKMLSRSRLLHNQQNGKYGPGRHWSRVTNDIDPDFFLCWFGWSPFDYVKSRKLQIQTKVSEKQKTKKQWAMCYLVDEEKIEQMFQTEANRSYDLLTKDRYVKAYNYFKDNYRD